MKKGQATLFIILGIVVLVVVMTLTYTYSDTLKDRLSGISSDTISIPRQIQPVKDYIDDCIEEVSLEGIQLMGSQGGYIDVPEDIIPRSIVNPFSNSLEIFPGYEVAYWFYQTANGILKTEVPSKEVMEEQLAVYIEENLGYCLNNFDVFVEQGYIIEKDDKINAKIRINPKDVRVDVEYDVNVEIQDVSRRLKNHFVDVDSSFGTLYGKAIDILNKENENYFLEEKTTDILIVYDDIPYSGESFDCVPKVWLKSEVEEKLKEAIYANLDNVKIVGSPNTNVAGYFLFDTGTNFNNINANFRYITDWPFELSIDGGEKLLKEKKIVGGGNIATSLLMTVFCLNNYNFIYDIRYPVLVILEDEDLLFQFATQVVVDNNQARENRDGIESLEDTGLACQTAKVLNKVYAIDYDTGVTLKDAEVSINCVGSICEIGKTFYDGIEFSLETGFPSCFNGELIVTKDGYDDANEIIDTLEGGETSVLLKKKYSLDLDIRAIENGLTRELRKDETVIAQIYNEEDKYLVSVTEENNQIELIEGDYYAQIFVMREGDFNIKGKDLEYCTDVPRGGFLGYLGFSEEKCFTEEFDDYKADQTIVGGENFAFTVDINELKLGNKFELYVMINGVPSNSEQLINLYDVISYNHQDPNFKLPEII